jgi:hypothetical protein
LLVREDKDKDKDPSSSRNVAIEKNSAPGNSNTREQKSQRVSERLMMQSRKNKIVNKIA